MNYYLLKENATNILTLTKNILKINPVIFCCSVINFDVSSQNIRGNPSNKYAIAISQKYRDIMVIFHFIKIFKETTMMMIYFFYNVTYNFTYKTLKKLFTLLPTTYLLLERNNW